jgi:hypothetical protein
MPKHEEFSDAIFHADYFFLYSADFNTIECTSCFLLPQAFRRSNAVYNDAGSTGNGNYDAIDKRVLRRSLLSLENLNCQVIVR